MRETMTNPTQPVTLADPPDQRHKPPRIGRLAGALWLAMLLLVGALPANVAAQDVDLGELGAYIDELEAAVKAFDPERARAEADELAAQIQQLEDAIEDEGTALIEVDGEITPVDLAELEQLVALARFMPIEDEEQRALLGAHVPGLKEVLERVDVSSASDHAEATEAARKALGQDSSDKQELAAATLERMKAEIALLDAGVAHLEGMLTEATAIRTIERRRRSGDASPFGGSFTQPWGGETMQLGGSGTRVIGEFDYRKGQVIFRVTGPYDLEGFWIEDGEGRARCAGSKLGNDYYGTLNIKFNEDYSAYQGSWNYCDASPTGAGGWSGKRIGAAEPGYAFDRFTDVDDRAIDIALGTEPEAISNVDGSTGDDPGLDPGDTSSDAGSETTIEPPSTGRAAIERLSETVDSQLDGIKDAGSGVIEIGTDDIAALMAAVPKGTIGDVKLLDGKIEVPLVGGNWRAVFIYPTVDKATGELKVELKVEARGLLGLAEFRLTKALLEKRHPGVPAQLDGALSRIEGAARERGLALDGILITDEGMSVRVKTMGAG